VAGGNDRGRQLNRLDRPQGIFVDTDKTMYIADWWNDRVVQWKRGEMKGEIIAGIHTKGNRIDQLSNPTDVILDRKNNALIIADQGNRRVVRWSIQNKTKQEVLVSNIRCWGLAMGKDGSIYVSDYKKHEVQRWKEGEKRGEVVAGGNGKGSQLDRLNKPRFIFIDDDYSLYVSDRDNHRVMKWPKGTKQGIVVAGGNNKGKSLKHLSNPEGVIVDRWGQIYVADFGNQRVMRWNEGNEEGEVVVGGNGVGSKPDQLNGLSGLSFDTEGNLYVVDAWNHRVQKFEKDVD
jgi:sugar lactone lactonase YvrE